MLRTTAHHERALQVRPISPPTILFFCDANLGFSTSHRVECLLARILSRNLSPISPARDQKHNVTVRGKCVIYTSEGNGVEFELRSFRKPLHNAPLLRSPRTPNRRLRGSPKAGNAAKGNRFHKTVGNKGTNGGRGRQFYGLSGSVLRSPSVLYGVGRKSGP